MLYKPKTMWNINISNSSIELNTGPCVYYGWNCFINCGLHYGVNSHVNDGVIFNEKGYLCSLMYNQYLMKVDTCKCFVSFKYLPRTCIIISVIHVALTFLFG